MAKTQRKASAAKRNTKEHSRSSFASSYVEGNTVRRLQPRIAQPEIYRENSRRTEEEALPQMNLRFVLFLLCAASLTVIICMYYLKLQSQSTKLQKQVNSLNTELSEMKMENDSAYNRIISSVDLEHVRDVAMNELGMVYASNDQIHTYESLDSDYVKQFQDIPQ